MVEDFGIYYNANGTSGDAGASGGLAGTLGSIGAGVNIASTIATTISGIIDQGKRRKFEQSLALLSSQQQKELNEKLLATNNQTERLRILTETLVQYASVNQNTIAKNKVTLYIIAGILGIAILGLAVFVIKND